MVLHVLWVISVFGGSGMDVTNGDTVGISDGISVADEVYDGVGVGDWERVKLEERVGVGVAVNDVDEVAVGDSVVDALGDEDVVGVWEGAKLEERVGVGSQSMMWMR